MLKTGIEVGGNFTLLSLSELECQTKFLDLLNLLINSIRRYNILLFRVHNKKGSVPSE